MYYVVLNRIKSDLRLIHEKIQRSLIVLLDRGETLHQLEEQTARLSVESQLFNQEIRRHRLGPTIAYVVEQWEQLTFCHSLYSFFASFCWHGVLCMEL